MSEIEMTGERYIPEMEDEELELEHMERYYAASRLTEGKTVLDAACGEGYGCYLMAKKAGKVIGIDLDAAAIAHAKRKYSDAGNLTFLQAGVDRMDMVEDHTIDVVTSFETIEHVSEAVQHGFISEIHRVLKPEGILIMSSPNRKEYSDRYHFHNKFHIHELYVDEFARLLKGTFRNVRMYRQYLEVASWIDQTDVDEETLLCRKDSSRYAPEGKYAIAVAGNAALPEQSLSMVHLHLREEYLPLLEKLYAQRVRVGQLQREKEACEQELEREKEACEQELERRADELEHRMEVINEANAENSILKNELKLCREELERRADELEHRMQAINELQAFINQSRMKKAMDFIRELVKGRK